MYTRTAVIALILLAPTSALAERGGWSADHPIAIGTRASGWVGAYSAPGLGGHFKIRPFEWVGVETFLDNFGIVKEGTARHDHVIGFSLYFPTLLGNRRVFVSPTLGTCVDFRFIHNLEGDNPATKDILFGLHAGVSGEWFVGAGVSVEVNATLFGYLGHDSGVERWTSRISNELGVSWNAQLLGAVSYYF